MIFALGLGLVTALGIYFTYSFAEIVVLIATLTLCVAAAAAAVVLWSYLGSRVPFSVGNDNARVMLDYVSAHGDITAVNVGIGEKLMPTKHDEVRQSTPPNVEAV